MSDSKTPRVGERRGFLKGALLAGGTAAVTSSASAASDVFTDDAPTSEAKPETTVKYKETDHIKTYYRLARF